MGRRTPHSKRTNDIDRYIGGRIRLWRHALNIEPKQLCGKLNISYQQLQKYEKGINRVSASTLYQIAQELRIPINYFYEADEIAVHDVPRTTQEELRQQLTAIKFMSTKTALRLCLNFNAIGNPYIEESLLNLIVAIAGENGQARPAPSAIRLDP